MQRLTSYLRLVLAPNPGPMTLEGTNTWVVGDPDVAPPIVVDPGPSDSGHREAVLEACGGRVFEIVLTHRHGDHSDGAAELARAAGCGVRAADATLRIAAAGATLRVDGLALSDGLRLEVAGATLQAYGTPGHTSDSFSLLIVGDDGVSRMATGDTVLGRGTSVIARPDGDLAGYFGSLDVLSSVVREHGVLELLPGHGPRVGAPAEWLEFYRSHRLERLRQVRQAVAAGDRTPAEVVRRVYADLDPSVRAAAEQSVAAQLEYLGLPEHS